MLSQKLAKDLPLVQGDRVHTATGYGLFDHQRRRSKEHELLIRSVKTKSGSVLVVACNSGPGVNPENLERIFHACFATKADGLGMDLSICRAIIEAPGGQLSATRARPGAPSCIHLTGGHGRRIVSSLVGTSHACATDCEIAAMHESVVDAVDGSSTGTRVPWMWTLLRLQQFRGASPADRHDSRSRYRQISLPGSRN
jgi:hypothetical protein